MSSGLYPAKSGSTEPKRLLVLIGTSTREKIDQYSAIARAKHVPVEFRLLTDVVPYFHSSSEKTGDEKLNAADKLLQIRPNITDCRLESSASNLALRRKCKEWGIKYDPANIYFAVDDSTFTVTKDIWGPFKKKLAPYVEEDLLMSKRPKKIPRRKQDQENTEVGPGAEFGPIVAAVGMTRFFDLLREAAQEAGYDKRHAAITQHVTMLLESMDSQPAAAAIELAAKRQVYLHAPKGLGVPFEQPKDPIAKSEHFLRENGRNQPISNDWVGYVTQRHERADIVDQLVKKVLKYNGGAVDPARPTYKFGRNFVVGLPNVGCPDDFVKELKRAGGINVAFGDDAHVMDTIRVGVNKREAAISQENLINQSDALLFTPFDSSGSIETRTANYLAFFSAKVAKQLIARDMNKPIIVMNLKGEGHERGCWQDAVDMSLDLVDKGMFKDHLMNAYEPSAYPETRDVHHMATKFYDVLTSDNPEKLRKAAVKLLEHRRNNCIPFAEGEALPKPDELVIGGGVDGKTPKPAPDGMFKVAVFVSATNDNKRLITDMRGLGSDLAEKEFGLIWGGGDRHGMGAVYDGYKHGRAQSTEKNPNHKTWIGGFSTLPILGSETEHGKMPEGLDYWEQNKDIYQRMAHMIHKDDNINSNAIVVAPGGDGTFQEWLAVMHMKHQFPKLMEKKSLIIYAPDMHDGKSGPFWEKGMRIVMGDKFFDTISQHHRAYKEQGIYLATNERELMKLIEGLREKETGHTDRVAESLRKRHSEGAVRH